MPESASSRRPDRGSRTCRPKWSSSCPWTRTGGFRKAQDTYGYHWLVVEDADIEELVTRIHLVNSSLSDAGWGPQLLCSVFGLAELTGSDTGRPPGDGDAVWSRLLSAPRIPCRSPPPVLVRCSRPPPIWSTCSSGAPSIPSCPTGHEQRDIEQELKLKSLVADDLVDRSRPRPLVPVVGPAGRLTADPSVDLGPRPVDLRAGQAHCAREAARRHARVANVTEQSSQVSRRPVIPSMAWAKSRSSRVIPPESWVTSARVTRL